MGDEELRDAIRRLDGLFYGSLSNDERDVVDEAVKLGIARRVYEGTGGFLGLSRVRLSGSGQGGGE